MKIVTSSITKPPRLIIYSEHKVGKSTFAAGCPRPIFIDTEGGVEALGVQTFERAKSYEDVVAALEWLLKEPHDYKTMVLDSLDWTEKLIWEKICKENGWAQLGDGPYGAGYKLALNYWRALIKLFEAINTERKMVICLLAHAKISKFESAESENYDRWDVDLHEKSGNLLCEFVDIIGFANIKVQVVTKKQGFAESTKAKSTGERQLNVAKKAAFEAGNRYSLPDSVALNWSALADEISKYFVRQKPGNLSAVKEDHEVEKAKRKAKKETEQTEPVAA